MMENLLAEANETSLRYARTAFLISLVSLAIGGVAATVIGFSRAMIITSIEPGLYYRSLTIHGANMPIPWPPFFEVGALYAIMATSIKRPPCVGSPRLRHMYRWRWDGSCLTGALFTDHPLSI